MIDYLISIVCPVYNCSQFLEECIFSVIEQTDNCWELILIDDGSTDNSDNICDIYSEKDSRIKVIHKPNHGQMLARIDGIKKCSGSYVLFLDSDDLLDCRAVETIRNQLILDDKIECFLFNGTIFPETSKKSLPLIKTVKRLDTNKDVILSTFGDEMFGYLWMYCFKKDVLIKTIERKPPFLNVRYTEDSVFIYHSVTELHNLITLPVSLYKYRNNINSITHNLTNSDRSDRFKIFDYIYNDLFTRFENFSLSNELAISISWALFSYLEHTDDKKIFKEVFKICRKSILYRKICCKVKTKDKRFKYYRLLLKFNLPSIFFKLSHK